MPGQKYAPLRNEEDGEVITPQRDFDGMACNSQSRFKHIVINVVTFIAGLLAGLLLSNALPRTANEQLAQYSMVPCKYTPSHRRILHHSALV